MVFFLGKHSEYFCRIAASERIGRHGLSDNWSRSDHGAITYFYSFEDDWLSSDESVLSDSDRFYRNSIRRSKRDFVHVGITDQATSSNQSFRTYFDRFHSDNSSSRDTQPFSKSKLRYLGDEKSHTTSDYMGIGPAGIVDLHFIFNNKLSVLVDFNIRKAVTFHISTNLGTTDAKISACNKPIKIKGAVLAKQ